MAGYIRQSTFVDGDTITAALFNNEYNQLVNAFSNTSGHKHDGTTAEGPVIGLIGDAGETSPNNKVLIDTTNNYIEFYVEVSSAPVQQLYIADGAIIPVTDNDIDLGTSSLEFKNIYIDGTATIDTLTVDEAATIGTTLGVTGATTLSSTLAVTGTSTLTGNVTTTNDLSVGGNLTVTGNATISGNLTFGDADTDSINLAAEIDSNIVPNTDDTYDLGTTTKEWRNLYIDGTANIDSLVADTADINGGTIDGATIATSDITVGAGKTLDVSSGTLTLADDQISGNKVEGGTIAATTVTTLTSTTGNITNVNATTVDSTNLEVTNLKAKDGTSAGSIADSTGVVTLASSILTTTDINGGTIDGATIATSDITVGTGKTLDVSSGTLTLADNQISGDKVEGGTIAATTITALTYGSLSDGTITIAGFADEDNMVSDSATLVPTQQSVKAYVDAQVTAQDLDFQGDSGGALSIDLDSETLTIAGGTGIDTTGATNTLTVAIDSTVATLTGTQTLTNKTLTTPIISSISNTGTLTLPTSTDTLVGRATTDTLTNKTLTSPVLNTGVSGTAFLDDDTFATATASTLASSESIKAYVDAQVGGVGGGDVVDDTTPQLGGDLASNGNNILFADNDKAVFGASSDLQIYHDGSNSYIQDSGTGNLSLLANGTKILMETAGGETLAEFINNGNVVLYSNNVERLRTNGTGIDVTGSVVADGLDIDGTATITYTGTGEGLVLESTEAGASAAPDLALYRNSSSPADNDQIGNVVFKGKDSAGNETTYGRILVQVDDVTDGTEDSTMFFNTMSGGALGDRISIVGETTTIAGNLSVDGGTIKLDGNYPTGTRNVALGDTALDSVTSGINNVAIGHNSATALTDGNNNTALGAFTFAANTSGTSNTALGKDALEANTTADSNTAVGAFSLTANTTGGENTAVGRDSLKLNTTGAENTAVGYLALSANTTADANTAFGVQSLMVNTTGTLNSAFGAASLDANTTGSNNTAMGYGSLTGNTTASNNTAVGYLSLAANTTGNGNTAVGSLSLDANTTGIQNTAVGYLAASTMTTGNYNTAVGVVALQNYNVTDCVAVGAEALRDCQGNRNIGIGNEAGRFATGDDNVIIGDLAADSSSFSGNNNTGVGKDTLTTNSSGSNNVAVGKDSLRSNTTASNNTALGTSALRTNTTGTYNTAVGYAANYTTTGNYSTAVGYLALQDATAGANTAVGAETAKDITSGHSNVAMGVSAAYGITTGLYNVSLGHTAGGGTTGQGNIGIGYYGGSSMTTGSNNVVIGRQSQLSAGTGNNQIVMGYLVTGTGNNNFTFGNQSTDSNIAFGATSITAPSDIRLKEDIQDEEVGLNFVKDLRPVTFRWKKAKDVPSELNAHSDSEERVMNGKYNHGFIAQEVKEAIDKHNLKEGFDMWSEDEADGRQRIGEAALMPLMVKAVQELSSQVDELKAEIQTLKGE